MMWRRVLIVMQLLATVLFIWTFESASQTHVLAWLTPLLLIILVIINSVWFTRLVSWIIFSGAFFAFLVLLSAFTIRWRFETGFDAAPFYRTIFMYVAFIYICLAQIKILGPKKIPKGDLKP